VSRSERKGEQPTDPSANPLSNQTNVRAGSRELPHDHYGTEAKEGAAMRHQERTRMRDPV
jgi:hypothetical protein